MFCNPIKLFCISLNNLHKYRNHIVYIIEQPYYAVLNCPLSKCRIHTQNLSFVISHVQQDNEQELFYFMYILIEEEHILNRNKPYILYKHIYKPILPYISNNIKLIHPNQDCTKTIAYDFYCNAVKMLVMLVCQT